MKNLIKYILVSGSLLVGFACQKSNDAQVSTPAVSSDCVTNPQACQSQIYQQNAGFTTYPYNSPYNSGYNVWGTGVVYANNGIYSPGATPFYFANSAAYLCNCPMGTVPTYNTYAGLGCVQAGLVGSAYVGFSWGPNNGQWLNQPNISNQVGYPNRACYNGVVQSCIVGQSNTCAAGSTCVSSLAASNIGICQRN